MMKMKSLTQRIHELEREVKWRQCALDKQMAILKQLRWMRALQEAKE